MCAQDLVTLEISSDPATGLQATLRCSPDLALGPIPLRNIGAVFEDLASARASMTTMPAAPAQDPSEVDLHSFDAEATASTGMRDSQLRLVLELTDDASGGTYAQLRHFDQTIDYGPINVQDLPFLIEALLDEPVQVGAPRDS